MKFAIKLLIAFILFNNLCYAEVILRFQSKIESKANTLGDVLYIENDTAHWSKLPLQSNPTPGQWITQDAIISWMNQKIGHFEWKWQGATKTQVKQSIQSSSQDLLLKAKTELIKKLGSKYSRVEVTALSKPKDSEFALDTFKARFKTSYPSPKRVCVWLTHDKKQIPIWFKVHAFEPTLTAKKNLSPHTLIRENDFYVKERNIAGLKSQPIKKLAKNSWLKTSIEQGKILLAEQVTEAPLVVNGQSVKVTTHQNNITIIMEGIALEDGFRGTTIKIKNPINQQSFDAQITGPQQAEVRS